MWGDGDQRSLLEFSINITGMTFEIIPDDAKSHACFCGVVVALRPKKTLGKNKKTTRKSRTSISQDVKTKTTQNMSENSLPSDHSSDALQGRDGVPIHSNQGVICRPGTTDSGTPRLFSFDAMLKEASSTTDSALSNVNRPVRRGSLSAFSCAVAAKDQEVLQSICRNIMEPSG